MNNSLKTIEIIINPAGEATVQTKGFTGSACRDASKFIENALGDRTGEQLTPEFHQPVPAKQSLEQR